MANGSGGGAGFELKKFSGFGDMFKSTDPNKAAGAADGGVKELRLSALHAYKDHPFKPYNGQRLGFFSFSSIFITLLFCNYAALMALVLEFAYHQSMNSTSDCAKSQRNACKIRQSLL